MRDISGEGVQNALLTLVDGRTSRGVEGMVHPAVDTSRLLFVCAGAFMGLRDIVERRLGAGRNVIGFLLRPPGIHDGGSRPAGLHHPLPGPNQ